VRGLFGVRPSPALAVACCALAVALGGTSYAAVSLPANTVGTAQLKNGAVTAKKVRLHALLFSNLKSGQVLGSTITVVPPDASVAAGSFALQQVDCPSGYQALSGGVEVGNVTTVVVADSYPLIAGSPVLLGRPAGTDAAASGWHVAVKNTGSVAEPFKAVVICAASG
jgi:hypothetical protein